MLHAAASAGVIAATCLSSDRVNGVGAGWAVAAPRGLPDVSKGTTPVGWGGFGTREFEAGGQLDLEPSGGLLWSWSTFACKAVQPQLGSLLALWSGLGVVEGAFDTDATAGRLQRGWLVAFWAGLGIVEGTEGWSNRGVPAPATLSAVGSGCTYCCP